jgi:hypothetical protein
VKERAKVSGGPQHATKVAAAWDFARDVLPVIDRDLVQGQQVGDSVLPDREGVQILLLPQPTGTRRGRV